MEIIRMEPSFKEKIWGKDNLKQIFDKDFDHSLKIGESWEVSCLDNDSNLIANGQFTGMKIKQIWSKYPQFFSEPKFYQIDFPFLMKFIDAYQPLSIQVHPRVDLTSSKDELWYVVRAEPGAKIIYGLKEELDRNQIDDHIKQGTIESILNETEVKAGDIFSIPSGMIHSIGAGIIMFELQENSDITYRIFDWNRCSDRRLHIDQALNAFSLDENLRNPRLEYWSELNEKNRIQKVRFKENLVFEVIKMEESYESVKEIRNFEFLVFLDSAKFVTHQAETLLIKRGETVFVPNGLVKYSVFGKGIILRIYAE